MIAIKGMGKSSIRTNLVCFLLNYYLAYVSVVLNLNIASQEAAGLFLLKSGVWAGVHVISRWSAATPEIRLFKFLKIMNRHIPLCQLVLVYSWSPSSDRVYAAHCLTMATWKIDRSGLKTLGIAGNKEWNH